MLILLNAQIYTMDLDQPTAQAAAIEGRRVIAVGDDQQIISDFLKDREASSRSKVEVIDLQGQVVLPGLTDAHLHLEHFALGLQKVDCETETRQECLQRVRERANQTPPGGWILGHGWNQNNWQDGFGAASELDEISTSHPIYLTAKSLHAAWANSTALRIANLSDATLDPPGGRLGRSASGKLTGILFESAMDLVGSKQPLPDEAVVAEAIEHALPVLWRMGLTGVHDFDRRRCFSALQLLHQAGKLNLRVVKSIPLEDLDHAVALGLRSGLGDDFLRIGGIKAFADGALGPQTAAMLLPYNQDPGNRGMLLLDAEELFEHGRTAVANGLSLAVHAIGDRANHEVLDAYSQLRDFEAETFFKGNRGQAVKHGLRHRIEHVQLLHPDDKSRLSELGVIASMQPLHATSDMLMADRFWGDRSNLAYALRTQIMLGATIALGSDAPVESPDPFWGLHAAVTRQRQDGSPGPDGWYPEQRLSVWEALAGYTVGAAYAGYLENRVGQIRPGYLADLIVVNENPFTCPVDKIPEIQALATMIGGEWVLKSL